MIVSHAQNCSDNRNGDRVPVIGEWRGWAATADAIVKTTCDVKVASDRHTDIWRRWKAATVDSDHAVCVKQHVDRHPIEGFPTSVFD
jgi:hypothetical protein